MTATRALAFVTVLACTGMAQAQGTLGELLDRGAQKMTAAEAAHVSPLRVVRVASDSDAIMTLRADGTVVGTVHNKQGHGSSDARGTWTIDASGKRCVDVELPAFNMNWKQCGFLFRIGGELYSAASDTDRSVTVTPYAGTAYLSQ